MSANQPQPTHVALPIGLFKQVRSVVGQLPHDQVREICGALDQCQAVALAPSNEPPTAEPAEPGGE